MTDTTLVFLVAVLAGSAALLVFTSNPPALNMNHSHLWLVGSQADQHIHYHGAAAESGADPVISLFEYPGLQELFPILGGQLALPLLSIMPFLLSGIFWLFRLQRYRPAAIFLPHRDRPPLP